MVEQKSVWLCNKVLLGIWGFWQFMYLSPFSRAVGLHVCSLAALGSSVINPREQTRCQAVSKAHLPSSHQSSQQPWGRSCRSSLLGEDLETPASGCSHIGKKEDSNLRSA